MTKPATLRNNAFFALFLVLGAVILADVAAAQDPPGTEIYLVPLVPGEGVGGPTLGEPRNVSARPGYDNQPAFHPDGERLFYTAIVDGQADIFVYDLEKETRERLTETPESEYSPTPIPGAEAVSVVRVEADERQRLWRFPLDGGEPSLILPDVEPVGYHAWGSAERLFLFVLGEPPTLESARPGAGPSEKVAENIGRALVPLPGGGVAFVHKASADGRGGWTIRRVGESGEIESIAPARSGGEDFTVDPDGALWMAEGTVLYVFRPGEGGGWHAVGDLGPHGLGEITRLAVHPDGELIAVVAEEAVGKE